MTTEKAVIDKNGIETICALDDGQLSLVITLEKLIASIDALRIKLG